MAPALFKASAPGSLMLFGEHAVLHGEPALVGAVNRRMEVILTPRDDHRIEIISVLGSYTASLDALEPDERFRFLLEAVRRAGHLPSGFILEVASGFSATVGFGSSAAVTVAACAALAAWTGPEPAAQELLKKSVDIIRAVQGTGSGADAAASVYGGVSTYRAGPVQATRVDDIPPVSVIYSGYKTPTVEVIRQVEQAFADRTDELMALYREMGGITEAAAEALARQDLAAAGACMDQAQACMVRLGVSNPDLDHLATALCNQPGITGAKISGSGLGDCVIGIGQTDAGVAGFEKMDAVLAEDGVRIE